jgi:pimeloyl-ACP methyl ester carboxylesterase
MLRPDLVLIPGLLLKADLYAAQLPALHGRCRSIFVPDHAQDETIEAIARRVLSEAPARFALCGLSMGGYIAFEIMRQAPERVTRLALLDTMATPDTDAKRQTRREAVARAESAGIGVVSEAYYPHWVHRDHHSDGALRGRVRAMAEATGLEGFRRQQAAIAARVDSRPGLGAIKCPTLVLVGRQDELTPVSEAEIMASSIPGTTLRIIERCGHLATMEQPAEVTEALLAWLG